MKTLSLRIKVLIPVTAMIVTAILIALVIVNQVVRRQVLVSVSSNLENSMRVFQELQEKEWELLFERGWVTAEAPHLKAALDTGDSTTVQHVADDMFGTLRSDILIITNERDQVLAQHGLDGFKVSSFSMDSLVVQDELPEGEIGLMKLGADVYRVVSVPIVALDKISGVYLLGRVILGKTINADYIDNLKRLVNCEVAFVHGQAIVTTVDEALVQVIMNGHDNVLANADEAPSVFNVTFGHEEYLVEAAGFQGNFLLLQSVDRAFDPIMQPIEKTMLVVAGLAFLAAILIGTYISHQIVTPVKKLANATDAITTGDYGHPIEVRAHDEIGHLARQFDAMRQSLQQKMTQLKQQNLELEEALKKLEAAQEELVRSEKLAATGKITAQLSHELNNPIHNIQGCLEAARKRIAEGHASREFVDLAYDEVLRIGKLIRQMIDFYRPQVDSRENVQVNRIVREVLKTSESLFDKRRIRVICELSPDVGEIRASPDQLKQVFLNLIFNSVDAMPGGGTLRVSSDHDGHKVSIALQDTGCGITPQHLSKIFDAFFTTKTKASGVGLGLSVSYGIVRSHGGNILVESKVNEGSKFIVQLPYERNE